MSSKLDNRHNNRFLVRDICGHFLKCSIDTVVDMLGVVSLSIKLLLTNNEHLSMSDEDTVQEKPRKVSLYNFDPDSHNPYLHHQRSRLLAQEPSPLHSPIAPLNSPRARISPLHFISNEGVTDNQQPIR
jgi:hypothetical protein